MKDRRVIGDMDGWIPLDDGRGHMGCDGRYVKKGVEGGGL